MHIWKSSSSKSLKKRVQQTKRLLNQGKLHPNSLSWLGSQFDSANLEDAREPRVPVLFRWVDQHATGTHSCPSLPYRLDFLLSKQNEWSVKRPSGKMRGDPGGKKIGQKRRDAKYKWECWGWGYHWRHSTNSSVIKFCFSRSKFYFWSCCKIIWENQLRYHYNSCIIFMHVYCV